MTVHAAAADLRDACPLCQPGFPDASHPVGTVTEVPGGRVADFECTDCGTAWTSWLDRFGFVHARLIAPVAGQSARRAA